MEKDIIQKPANPSMIDLELLPHTSSLAFPWILNSDCTMGRLPFEAGHSRLSTLANLPWQKTACLKHNSLSLENMLKI